MRQIALVASGAAALGWAALVHAAPERFFLWGVLYCALWAGLSLGALGGNARQLFRPSAMDLSVGIMIGSLLFVATRGLLWALCGGFSSLLCVPLEGLFNRFELGLWPAASLALVMAPAEELFWRGLVQPGLRSRLGPTRALLATSLIASAVLLLAGEPLLALAALPTYIVFGGLAQWRSLWAAVAGHSLWDLLVALTLPPGS